MLDAFHVVRLGLDAVDQVRRRVQQETLGHRGHAGDPLFRIRRLLRRGDDTHRPPWTRLLAGLAAGDPRRAGRPGLDRRSGTAAALPRADRDRAEQRLFGRWFTTIAEHDIPELVRLARTLDGWRDELLAYFDTGGVSNGPTEAINAADQEGQAGRARLPQLQQLPATPTPALRHRLAHSRHGADRQRARSGLGAPRTATGRRLRGSTLGDRMDPGHQRTPDGGRSGVASLREPYTTMIAVVDGAARWLDEPDGEEYAYALLGEQ